MNGRFLDNPWILGIVLSLRHDLRQPRSRVAVALTLSFVVHAGVVTVSLFGKTSHGSIGQTTSTRPQFSHYTARLTSLASYETPIAPAAKFDSKTFGGRELAQSAPQQDTPSPQDAGTSAPEGSGKKANKEADKEISKGADWLEIDGVPFYRPDSLTRLPQVREALNFDVPALAGLSVDGMVALELWIDLEGRVVAVRPTASTLSDIVVEAIGRVLRAAEFVPAQIAGKPVGSILQVEVTIQRRANTIVPSFRNSSGSTKGDS